MVFSKDGAWGRQGSLGEGTHRKKASALERRGRASWYQSKAASVYIRLFRISIQLSTYSSTHPPVIRLSTHLPISVTKIHLTIYLSIHPLTHLSTYLSTYSQSNNQSTHLYTYQSIHPSHSSIYSPTHLSIYSPIHSSNHVLIHSSIHLSHLSTHLFIYSSTHMI